MGTLVEEEVQLWLARDDGELLATMWPGETGLAWIRSLSLTRKAESWPVAGSSFS